MALTGSAITSLQNSIHNLTATAPVSIANNDISTSLTQYQPLLTSVRDLSLASGSIYGIGGNATAGITTAGQVIAKRLNLTSALTTSTASFDDSTGFSYTHDDKLTGTDNIILSVATKDTGTTVTI